LAYFNVVQLDIFGYALREDDEPNRSEIDFFVVFGSISPFEKPDAYFGLLNELRTTVTFVMMSTGRSTALCSVIPASSVEPVFTIIWEAVQALSHRRAL
jgi:hypothetical protein